MCSTSAFRYASPPEVEEAKRKKKEDGDRTQHEEYMELIRDVMH